MMIGVQKVHFLPCGVANGAREGPLDFNFRRDAREMEAMAALRSEYGSSLPCFHPMQAYSAPTLLVVKFTEKSNETPLLRNDGEHKQRRIYY